MRRTGVRRWIHVPLTLVLLAMVVGLALLTRFPDWPPLRRAAAWPVIGPAARAFRARYLPRDPAANPAGLTEFELVSRSVGARPHVWVDQGAVLRTEPVPGAEAVATVGALSNLPVEERWGDWALVELEGRLGWVLPRPDEERRPGLGSRPSPVLPLTARAPDAEVVAKGVKAFHVPPAEFSLGDYVLLTDEDSEPILERCRLAVRDLEEAYRDQFGVEPIGQARGVVLLFSRQVDYEAFWRATTGRLATFSGHADRGVVSTYAAARPPIEICATVIHEISHLLNLRAIGPALPPWLEEGLSVHMAIRRGGRMARWSALRSAAAAGSLPTLTRLVEFDDRQFRTPARLQLHYDQSGAWVMFLVEDATLGPRFREFLHYLSLGGPFGPGVEARDDLRSAVATAGLRDDLEVFLGATLSDLDERFRGWLLGRTG